MTDEMLDRFARGDLEERELLEVLQHLDACPSCARAGEARVGNDVAALRRELSAEPPAVNRRPAAWTLVAAAAIIVALVSVLLRQRSTPDPAPQPRIVATPSPAPRQPETSIAEPPAIASAYADPEWQQLIISAKESGRLSFPAELDVLRAPADVVRGSAAAQERVDPSGVVIDEVRPTFTWPPRDGATYLLSVFHEDRKLIQSPPLEVPRWRPDRDLPRGRTLAWQVEVMRGGPIETIPRPPSPPALLLITSEADHHDIDRARELYPDDHLLHAVLYARAGMRSEALSSLRRAAAVQPSAKRILDHETSIPN